MKKILGLLVLIITFISLSSCNKEKEIEDRIIEDVIYNVYPNGSMMTPGNTMLITDKDTLYNLVTEVNSLPPICMYFYLEDLKPRFFKKKSLIVFVDTYTHLENITVENVEINGNQININYNQYCGNFISADDYSCFMVVIEIENKYIDSTMSINLQVLERIYN